MLRYAIRRLLTAVPTLLLVAALVFALLRIVPGDPASLMLGDAADPQALADLRQQLGLDRPLFEQFVMWLADLMRGEWGASLSTGEPVFSAILARFGVTAQVVLLAFAAALCVAVPLGLATARRQDSGFDAAVVATAVLCLSVPSFWVGLMLMLVFGVELGWLPTVGYVSTGEDLVAGIRYLLLPALALVFVEIGQLLRMMRSSSIETMRLDYVLNARARGLPEALVMRRHVFPNAFAPTLTLAGMLLGSLLGGAAVVETVFTLPGLGRYIVDALYQRDYPVVQGALLFVAVIQVAMNLLIDLLYPLFDPRVRL